MAVHANGRSIHVHVNGRRFIFHISVFPSDQFNALSSGWQYQRNRRPTMIWASSGRKKDVFNTILRDEAAGSHTSDAGGGAGGAGGGEAGGGGYEGSTDMKPLFATPLRFVFHAINTCETTTASVSGGVGSGSGSDDDDGECSYSGARGGSGGGEGEVHGVKLNGESLLRDLHWWPSRPEANGWPGGWPPHRPTSLWSLPRQERPAVPASPKEGGPHEGFPYRAALVLRSRARDDTLLSHWLLPTLDMFVDPAHFEVWVVLDNTDDDRAWGKKLQAARPGLRVTYIKDIYQDPTYRSLPNDVKKKVMWEMKIHATLHMDEYIDSDAELIGVIDADSMIYGLMTRDTILDDRGKAYIRCGNNPVSARNDQLNPNGGYTATLAKELDLPHGTDLCQVMYGERMPQWVWRDTFAKMRSHAAHKWKSPSFAEGWYDDNHPERRNSCDPIDVLLGFGIRHQSDKYHVVQNRSPLPPSVTAAQLGTSFPLIRSPRPTPPPNGAADSEVVAVAFNWRVDEGLVRFGCCHAFGGPSCNALTGVAGTPEGMSKYIDYIEQRWTYEKKGGGSDAGEYLFRDTFPRIAFDAAAQRYRKGIARTRSLMATSHVEAMRSTCNAYLDGSLEMFVGDFQGSFRRRGFCTGFDMCQSVFGNEQCIRARGAEAGEGTEGLFGLEQESGPPYAMTQGWGKCYSTD